MNKTTKKFQFEFFFYNDFASNFEKYFEEKMRLPVWNEDTPMDTMTGEFLEFDMSEGKIIGFMNLLINENENLFDKKNRKYLMNHPDRLVGHLILLD